MTVVIVLGIVLAVIALLLFSSVRVEVVFTDQLLLTVRYLFIKHRVFPPQEQKKKRQKPLPPEKKEEEPEDKAGKLKELLKGKGLSGLLSLLGAFAKLAASSAQKLFSHLVIGRLFLSVQVAGEDAAETAVTYGRVCALAYPAVNTLVQVARCKSYEVHIFPDFNEKKTEICLQGRARIRLIFLVWIGLSALIKGVKILKT